MRERKFIFFLLLFSFLPLISLFVTPLLFHTHDGVVHLARIAAYKKALSDFEFPLRWAGELNYGYGMPLFNFIYQLPYFVSSIFLFLGTGLVLSFKLSIALSYILAGITMYLFAKEFFGDSKKAFLVAIFYQFAPFRIVELLIRGSFGEMYAYAFAPLVLYFIARILRKNNVNNKIGLAISTALLVVSHNALSLIFFGVAVLFIFVLSKTSKQKISALVSLFYGLCLSAFYWVPALLEHKYTYGDLFMKDMYRQHFPPIQNFILPNFFNDIHFQTGGIDVQIGIFHLIAIVLGVCVLFGKKVDEQNKLILISLSLVALSLFMMQPISITLWEHQNFLRQFQFPWRFLGLTAFAASLCSVSLSSFKWFDKKYIYGLIIFLTIFSTAYFWNPPLGFDKIDEQYYWNYPLNTTYFGETDLIWSAGRAYSFPKSRVEVIDGQAVVSNFQKKTTIQTFKVQSDKGAKLIDHTQYYPGWKVMVNNQEVPIEYQYQIYPGQLVFKVPSGNSSVVVKFTETKPRLIADLISLFSFVGLIIFFLKRKHV